MRNRLSQSSAAILRRVLFPLALCAALAQPSAAAYHMYRKPLTRPFSYSLDRLSRSPRRNRPFEYRKSFAPRTVFRDYGLVKALPPLDLRIKPETPADILRGDIFPEETGYLFPDLFSARETGDVPPLPVQLGLPQVKLRRHSGDSLSDVVNRGPLRFACARSGNHSPSPDPVRMLSQLSDAISRHTGIAVRNRGQITPDSDTLDGLDIIFLAERESIPDPEEISSISRFLRTGGFAVIDCPASGAQPDRLREAVERSLAESSGSPVLVLPVEPAHPVFRSFFDLTASGYISGSGLKGIWIGNRLAALCSGDGAPLLSTRTNGHEQRLQFLVNTVIHAFTNSGTADPPSSR